MPWMRSERQPLPRLEALVLAALPVSAGVLSPQALAIRPTAAIAGMLLGMLTAEIIWPRSLSSGAQQAALAMVLQMLLRMGAGMAGAWWLADHVSSLRRIGVAAAGGGRGS